LVYIWRNPICVLVCISFVFIEIGTKQWISFILSDGICETKKSEGDPYFIAKVNFFFSDTCESNRMCWQTKVSNSLGNYAWRLQKEQLLVFFICILLIQWFFTEISNLPTFWWVFFWWCDCISYKYVKIDWWELECQSGRFWFCKNQRRKCHYDSLWITLLDW
jgi:hypothetical protein